MPYLGGLGQELLLARHPEAGGHGEDGHLFEVVLLQILIDAVHRHLVRLGGLEDPDAVLGRSRDGAAGGAGNQRQFGLLGDFQGGHGGVGETGADDGQAILVLGQLGGVEPGLGHVAFVVINDQLQGMPIDAPWALTASATISMEFRSGSPR